MELTLGQWLLDNLLNIAALVVIGLMAWSRVKKVDKIEEQLEAHRNDPEPHVSCPVHTSRLGDVVSRLEEICTEIRDLRKDNNSLQKTLLGIVLTGKSQ